MFDVTVVCGIIEYNDKILIGKKIECEHPAHLGGKWHLPGGKVEKGEALEAALKREVKEETNLDIEIKEKFGHSVHTTKTGVTAKVVYFRCIPKTNDFRASDDMQELKWIEKRDVLNKLDKQFIEMLPERLIDFLKVP